MRGRLPFLLGLADDMVIRLPLQALPFISSRTSIAMKTESAFVLGE